MKTTTNQLSREDINKYSKLAGNQQIIRKIKIGTQDIIISAENNHVLDGNAYVGLDIAIFAEQTTVSETLKAANFLLSTDVIVLGENAVLDTSGEDGAPIPGIAVDTNGQQGNPGTAGGYIYLYVNTFPIGSKPIGIKTKGGRGGTGQISQNEVGGIGGTGGDGGNVVIIFSNSYLLAQNYLKEIAGIFKNQQNLDNNPANLVAFIDAFCSIMTDLYPTKTAQESTKISDTLTLSSGIKKLKNFSKTFGGSKTTNLPDDIKTLLIDFGSMLQILDDEFQNQFLKQQLNASGGGQGVGGHGDGGAKNGPLGVVGTDGKVIEIGFMSSPNLVEGLLEPSFYDLLPPFMFLHPNQLQMVLEKARLQILFSDPSTPSGIAHIKGAKNLLDRLTYKTKYFSKIDKDAKITKFYKRNQHLIGCQNSITIFNQIYNEATRLSNQLIQGLDAYGHNYNYAPRGTYQMYKSALNEMIDSFIEIETAYLTYSNELNEQKAQISYLTNRRTQLNTIQSRSKENINALIAAISRSMDLIESYTAQLKPFVGKISDDITQIVASVKNSFDFDVKAFLGSLTSIAFAPESALMWGTQAASILYSGITNIKNDQGIDVKKSYLVNGIKQISGAIKGQMLAESFQQLNSGIIQLQDPGGNKIIADENQLMKLLDQFYSKFPSEIDNVKKDFQNYIDLVQKRNSEVVNYNQLLIMAEKELIALDKAKLLVQNINQNKFDNVDPALPEISGYMTYIYNHARSELLEQLYRTSKAFDFWSVTKSNKLANSLNGLSPENVNSYLLQSINLSLETAFEGSPGFFPSPSGTFKGETALKITLNEFELGLLKVANSTTLTIKPPTNGAFYSRADVRLTQVGVVLELTTKPTKGEQVFIDIVQLGKEKIQNPTNLEWYDYVHSPVVVECGFNTQSGKVTPATLVSNISNNNQDLQLANIGPYATWRVQINPKRNVGFDIHQIKSVTLQFEGTFYDTISS